MRHLLIPIAMSFGIVMASTANAQVVIGDPPNLDGFTVGVTDCLGCLPNVSGPTPGGYVNVNPPGVDGFLLGNPVPGPIVFGVDPIYSGRPTSPTAAAGPGSLSGVPSSLLFPSIFADGFGRQAGGGLVGSGNNPVPLSGEENASAIVAGNTFYAVENGVGQADRIRSIGDLVLLSAD